MRTRLCSTPCRPIPARERSSGSRARRRAAGCRFYAPPPEASQADIVDFFVGSLTPEWESSTRTVTASGEDVDPDAALPSSFRVLFSRGDDCLQLLTYGMAPGHIGERTFALSVESGQGPCEVD